MEQYKGLNIDIEQKRLGTNQEFYNNVFKKTERVVSAVFYMLSFIANNKSAKSSYEYATKQAIRLHEVATDSLGLTLHDSEIGLYHFKQALVTLGSTLVLLEGARLAAPIVVAQVNDEIDDILRYLKNHFTNENTLSRQQSKSSLPVRRPTAVRRLRPPIPPNDVSSDAIMVYSQLSDRTTRIKTVLEAKSHATIKDLTDIITDVSAKTIQRDLNALIETGIVKRQGERRWSTYSLS